MTVLCETKANNMTTGKALIRIKETGEFFEVKILDEYHQYGKMHYTFLIPGRGKQYFTGDQLSEFKYSM